jgi:hypothetical protein
MQGVDVLQGLQLSVVFPKKYSDGKIRRQLTAYFTVVLFCRRPIMIGRRQKSATVKYKLIYDYARSVL